MAFKLKKVLKSRILRGFLYPLVLFFALIYLIPLPEKITAPQYSTVIKDRNGKVLRVYLSKDGMRRIFVPLDKIDPLLIKTTIVYEDRFYYYHPGFNPVSILKAAYIDLKNRKIISGASTIPMQLARIAEPKPRTIPSKLIEIFRAIQFTLRLGKKKTLELYLNLAPYGGNIEGVGAASLSYFGKLPEKLLPGEIAFLVSLPQSPSLRMPGRKQRKDARDKVLKRMLKHKLITKKEYKKAFEIPAPEKKRKFPFFAPHICDYAKKLYPEKKEIVLSIDFNIQKKCERILKTYKYHFLLNGATNSSVIVIDNRNSKVVAAIGSLNYFDKKNSGQVIGFTAYRSPGSALKPFLYALALQKGVITTESLIEDAPYNLNGFSPKNFSGKWHGLIKAEDALSFSLNMPFAILLRRTGYEEFVNLLYKGGVKGLLDKDQYGLAIITGGMETRLIDLTNLYSALARRGIFIPWSILKDEKAKKGKPLLRYGACYLTLKALKKRGRPDAPELKNFVFPEGDIYWKTGTSWGRRDAWSLGFKNRYTVGVWVGNFDGKGASGIVGSNLASPVMFDIIKAIDKTNEKLNWEWKGIADTEEVEVCKFSGFRPNGNCPETKRVLTVKGVNPYYLCKFHKKVLLEKKTGKLACPEKSYKEGELEEKTILVFPPLVSLIMHRGFMPQYPKNCGISSPKGSVRIVSPTPDTTIVIPKGVNFSKTIPLQATTSTKDGTIYWFVNDKFIGQTKSEEKIFITPKTDRLKIVAVDSSSSLAKTIIKIKRE
ncbi:penicillin-binding protein 1C [Thermotomaculum hydrothermale]|uniref:peptidoglycan glycosyltransferase n=1 Tax=Thermotomaculum hydrothermale TaxID=981385 RepID=A0A7R6PZ26_9BACT|nr:penicillin-binding protein 1C [Thermotomaculum hydrothermale]BBB33530.1 penicillin-binding protein 1C [Thermotomaculum hydrothermale]